MEKENDDEFKLPETIIPHRKPIVRWSKYNEFNEDGFFFSFMACVFLNIAIVYAMYRENLWIDRLWFWYYIASLEAVSSGLLYAIHVFTFGSRKRKDILVISSSVTTGCLSIDALNQNDDMRKIGIVVGISYICSMILRIRWIFLMKVPLKAKIKATVYYLAQHAFICFFILVVCAMVMKVFLCK